MPTPFYHLSLAEDLICHPRLPDELHQFLITSRPTFLFGHTAPDVQVVSGQPRQQTHFFNLPIQAGDPPAWELFLSNYPNLADAQGLPPLQLSFLAGYLCHLQADWMWVNEIFAPVFGPLCTWGTFEERLYLHNVLRAYLDIYLLPGLQSGLDSCLSLVKPDGWLPFVKDHHLIKWRDMLVPQLQPGAATLTVEVFSSRQGISAPEFRALLKSEERMQQEIFQHLPLQQIWRYRQRVLDENVCLLTQYLAITIPQVVSQNRR